MRCAHRIGMPPTTRITHRRDVIDVDAEAQRRGQWSCV
jgi:hypothetical protein